MKKTNYRFAAKFLSVLLAAMIVCLSAPVSRVEAAQSVQVSSEEEFISAAADDTVSAIALTVPSIVLSEGFTVSRDLAIYGSPAVLELETGAQIKVSDGATLRLEGIDIRSTEGYSVSCYGSMVFGENVTISGDYGILLNGGASATSEGHQVSVAATAGRALGVSPAGGQVVLFDLDLAQSSGSTHLVYLHQSAGELILNRNINIYSSNSNAIMCPNNGSVSPSVKIQDNANVTVFAPKSANTGGSSAGGAIDTVFGTVTVGSNASLSITGGESAITADAVHICSGARLDISCPTASGANSAISARSSLVVEDNSVISIGAGQESASGGLYSGGGIELGSGCQLLIRCTSGASGAVRSAGPITAGDDLSLTICGAKDGIVTDHGLVTGSRCSLDISGASRYGIKGTGTLIADKLIFGSNSALNIAAGYCAVYSREAFQTESGSIVSLSAGSEAPALWIDAEKDSPGYITITGTNLTVTSSAGASAVHNAGVFSTGALTVEENSVFYAECSSDFGIMTVCGDVNVSSGASLYVRSGCGIYTIDGDIRLSSGGALFVNGVLDSAVRVEGGVVNIGDSAVADLQGSRFGVEIIGMGGLRISGAALFDIRSINDRAVYIEDGTLSIDSVERVSVWERSDDKTNTEVWWETQPDTSLASWQLTDPDSGVKQNYADHTQLYPAGTQTFRSGEPVDISSLDWYDSPWQTVLYSRIGMYKSRPVARANTFNIPAGKSFSWWLYGESYDGGAMHYTLCNSSGEGEFQLSDNGRFTYTAPAYARGIQSFTFMISNSEGAASDPTEVMINVTASKPPIVYSATFTTPINEELLSQLNLHDYDGAISKTIVTSQPAHGTLTMSSDGIFLYTPELDFTGIDSFEYYSVDDFGDSSNQGYVSIIVGETSGIFACNDTYATDSSTEIGARLILLDLSKSEDTAPVSPSDISDDGELMDYNGCKFIVTRRPEYGTFSVSEDGMVSYTPFDDFAGSDYFVYCAQLPDGTTTNEAIVTLAIIPSQRPSVDDSYFICSRNYHCSGSVAAADIDGSIISFELVTEPECGVLEFDALTGEFRFEPQRDFIGTVSFTFTAMDDDGLVSGKGTVYIQVMSFMDSLRASGRLIPAILAAGGMVTSLGVIIWLLVSASRRRKKREQLELQEFYRENQYASYNDMVRKY